MTLKSLLTLMKKESHQLIGDTKRGEYKTKTNLKLVDKLKVKIPQKKTVKPRQKRVVKKSPKKKPLISKNRKNLIKDSLRLKNTN
jgi:hypothetical protein